MSHPSTSGSSLPPQYSTKQEDSDDEDLFTVPDVESGAGPTTAAEAVQQQQLSNSSEGQQPQKSRRGRNPADKEYRRLKRVSAQQARERNKDYMNDMESKAQELHDRNLKLEERISTLVNENTMLRKVLMNTRPKVDKGADMQNEQLGSN